MCYSARQVGGQPIGAFMDPEAFERQQRSFFENWRLYVAAHDEYHRHTAEGAVAFAQTALKAGLLLNGGGLILMPAYVVMFSLSTEQNLGWLIAAAIGFLAGLLSGWLGTGAAYFTMVSQGNVVAYDKNIAASEIQTMHFPPDEPTASNRKKEVEQWRLKREVGRKISERWRWTGIGFSILSFFGFIAGAGFMFSTIL